MAWYRAGTTALTNGSNVVAGSGTSFLQNVRSGDIFVVLSDNVLYEVDQVVSATQLTLKTSYGGAANASAAYEIIPTASFLKTLAGQVTDLITLYNNIPQTAIDAQAAATSAQGYRDAAAASAKTAADSIASIQALHDEAAGFATAAGTSETNAAASATQASADATAAGDAVAAAATQAGNSAGSATQAQGFAQAAADSVTQAQNWSTKTDGPVSGTDYSAKFYAAQAASVVASIAFPISIADGGTGATDEVGARTALGLGSAATVNTGTSGSVIPMLDGANTWSALQTFSTRPKVGTNDVWDKGNLASPMTLDGAQTISGVKTFTANVIVPTPSGSTSATNKQYVDAQVATKYTFPGALNPNTFLRGDGILNRAMTSVFQSTPGEFTVPGYEMHIPGVTAAMMYLSNNGIISFGNTNGGGSVNFNRMLLDGSGNMSIAGGLAQGSDERVKTNIELILDACTKLQNLRGVTWTRTDLPNKDREYAGVIAQDLQAVLPAGVTSNPEFTIPGTDEPLLHVDPMAVIGILVETVKDLLARVAVLEQPKS
jgi:hypothetical protein